MLSTTNPKCSSNIFTTSATGAGKQANPAYGQFGEYFLLDVSSDGTGDSLNRNRKPCVSYKPKQFDGLKTIRHNLVMPFSNADTNRNPPEKEEAQK
ncbi:hypothetical protein HY948_03440 [Candidatus Gottesmanbacteria bacterium]|nr:hypothetical protein [Candidatus Gottesmanbacteria bacterium]